MKEIITRLTNESPTFFKRIQAIAITIGAAGGAILGLPIALSPLGVVFVLPATLSTAAGYMVACGIVAAAIAKTPVADSSVLKKEEPKND